jgi:hypothetical protein
VDTPTDAAAPPAPAAPEAAGFLQSKDQQAAAYGFLSATSLGFGVAALAAPELLLSVAVGTGDASALDVAFTRIAGATMAISAAAEYSLRVRQPQQLLLKWHSTASAGADCAGCVDCAVCRTQCWQGTSSLLPTSGSWWQLSRSQHCT